MVKEAFRAMPWRTGPAVLLLTLAAFACSTPSAPTGSAPAAPTDGLPVPVRVAETVLGGSDGLGGLSGQIGRASCRERVSVRVDLGGRRIIKNNKKKQIKI